VAGAERRDPVFTWKHRTALGDRFHVMNMQGAPTAAHKVREGALSVDDARAEVPPGLGVVRGSSHDVSLHDMLRMPVDRQSFLCRTFTTVSLNPDLESALPQLLSEVSNRVWS
jgi:hypothetical protein